LGVLGVFKRLLKTTVLCYNIQAENNEPKRQELREAVIKDFKLYRRNIDGIG